MSSVRNDCTENNDCVDESRKNQKSCQATTQTKPRKGKYFVSAKVGENIITPFIDTAADLSLISSEWSEQGDRERLKKPIKIKSFDEKSEQELRETVELKLKFGKTTSKMKFYICDVMTPIIGIDQLRDGQKQLSIDTETENFYVNNIAIKTAPNSEESVQRLMEREKDQNRKTKKSTKRTWLTVEKTTTLEPHQVSMVRVECDGKIKNSSHVFLSHHDEDDDSPLFIPSMKLTETKGPMTIWVENKSGERRKLEKGTPMGEIKICGNHIDEKTVMAFSAEEMHEIWETNEKSCSTVVENATPENQAPGDHENQAPEDQAQENQATEMIKLSSIIGQGKVEPATLEKCIKAGINVDLEIDVPEPEIDVNDTQIDVEKEMKKSKECPYWPDEEEFLGNFDLSETDDQTAFKARKLLLKFKHIFFNPKYPKQFEKGINTPPIKIKLKPGAPPLKNEKMRRMNAIKTAHLKQHMQQLLDQGVIEEMKDPSGSHLSPVHIVIERRYVASERRNVEKSRVVLDQRQLNTCIDDVAYPIPFCDEFRRKVAEEGYTVFSNCDAASFFYQFKIDYESAQKLFGFAALGRVWCLTRLCQGNKNSPPISQAFMEKAFRPHTNSHPFIDDITVKSKTTDEHLEEDLPKAFAICSHYNILLKPSKCDLLRPEVRVLGYQISRSMESLTEEKKEKIRSMTFPTTKKDAVSKAAFFAYFIPVAPKLSELIAPLRRLAQPKTRFKPTNEDKASFEKLKEHLLDPEVGAIRIPSNRQADTLIVWTDASSYAIGAIVTQMLPPLPGSQLDPTKKYLTIVACWSRTIEDAWSSHPIWVLELAALEETTRKFRWLLTGRVFYALTDSTTVRSWSSIEIVPKDIARKIIRLQRFNYRILFIEGRLNMSDWITRLPVDDQPQCKFPRFLENRIYNAKGEPVDWTKLFSQRKCDEAEEFFTRNRRQALSHAVTPLTDEKEEDAIDDEMERREVLEALMEPERENELKIYEGKMERKRVQGCTEESVAAFGLTDEEIEEGVDEQLEETPPDDDICARVELEKFAGTRLESVKNLQENDETITTIKEYIVKELTAPGKTEALALPVPIQQFFRHRSMFKINPQGILIRLWPSGDGQIEQLIVVGEEKYKALVKDIHNKLNSPQKHAGQRRTFQALNKRYFAFGARRMVNKIITTCPTCKLNSYPRTNPEKYGNQITTEPNAAGAVDVIGPLRGFAQTSTGRARYVFLYVDLHSRYTIGRTMNSTADSSLMEGFMGVKDELCGLPSKMMMDGAIATSNSESLRFLKERGVEVVHGIPFVSRCQAKIERQIQSIMRLVCKIQTANPSLPFHRLLAEAIFVANSTPSDGLAPGLAPKDVHFSRAPSNFLHHESTDESGGNNAMKAAREASRQTLMEDVKRYMKRQKLTSPTDYTSRLKVGQLCLRKRTIFPTSSPRKLCYKITVDGYRIVAKTGTNSFRCESIINKQETIIAGDHLIKINGLTEEELKSLCEEMESTAAREALSNSRPTPDGDTRRRTTRQRETRTRTAACVCRLSSLYE